MSGQENQEFVRRVLSKYYSQAQFDIKRVDQREFGVGNHKKIDARHLSFATTEQLRNFLVTECPRFVSHSAAYYRFPSATPQEKKGWLGADLVFDLDMHAEGKYDVYAKLEEMRKEVIKLVEDFLVADFGISKNDLLIAFSGNRGYHVHVRSEDYAGLGGEERREIMNYIRGEGLDIREFFSWEETSSGRKAKKLIGPKPDEGGYRGRLARMVLGILESEPAAISRIFANREKREFFAQGIRVGNWSRTSLDLEDIADRVSSLKKRMAVMTINADPMVTYDLSKLIRVPNSIHGETGFVAKIVADIDTFDPMRHAVINGPAVKAGFKEAVPKMEILNQTFGPFKAGDSAELPLGAALFFILKGSADKA